MGKASRAKKERTRERGAQWSAASAARQAHLLRRDTLTHLPGHPMVRAMVKQHAATALSDAYNAGMASGMSDAEARQFALTIAFGGIGVQPPFSDDLDRHVKWQYERTLKMLRQAEVFIVSPAAHAAAMAAAATLEIADTLTLQRDTDLPAPCGLLVLPEPVVLVNRTGALSDIRAYAWHFAQLHNGSPLQAAPGVQVAGFMDRDGPVQNEAWREFLAASKVSGWTCPPLVPDGFEGMRGDGYLSNLSTEELHERSALARQGQLHIREQAQWRAEPTPDVGEWTGGQVDDQHDDFTRRYIFAFWRLTAQGSTQVTRLGAPEPDLAHSSGAPRPRLEDVRVVRLTAPRTASQAAAADEGRQVRAYHHRWPVRMHKVRQWYPKAGEHRIIWRGPYIKGPADAPLLMSEKTYLVD
ncbi:hypothetical protein [Streptantibioticus ferralitis]|uniref:Uncharacterized protein n=1 Tax=Streptantibioticus ferralitis TaxID=236510 RepID=A0ABT5Z759_9ACTN|nr:hypothetical protein [Streptantibioticus ferralitis]MDF2259664.1 hypothetical protein [Streptantibioticus ferralitis]